MKVLGLLGGMSWESTIPYYRMINEQVKERLGGLHSAKIVLYSVDFQQVERLQHQGDWEGAGQLLAAAAVSLRRAGAEALVICTNTMHKVAEAVELAGLPLIHIADARAGRCGSRIFAASGYWEPASPWSRSFTAAACSSGMVSRW